MLNLNRIVIELMDYFKFFNVFLLRTNDVWVINLKSNEDLDSMLVDNSGLSSEKKLRTIRTINKALCWGEETAKYVQKRGENQQDCKLGFK